MIRNGCLSLAGLVLLTVIGCSRDSPTQPETPTPAVPDAELQQIEEQEFQSREQQAQYD